MREFWHAICRKFRAKGDIAMKNEKFQLEELTCPSCIKKIEGVLNRQNGIAESKVLFQSSKVKVVYDELTISSDQIIKIIYKLGYLVLVKEGELR